ncbi:MAG: UDP-2,3-diacetamido-2,3-dideoxy-D-glucuronate 2-epimerase [Thermotogae bacterium ADurb.Bin062]|nr:MAG: UDP-2,3-diacetamido-2,3-dideoxy-D-glucuronate 2-epimerase [Thermotogota bacterium ADurb.Bin062]
MIRLMAHAKKILTDSGGVQKEAYMLEVPCITLRENTEWVETVEAGWNVLVGAGREEILRVIRNFTPEGEQKPCFGDGDASAKVAQILSEYC